MRIEGVVLLPYSLYLFLMPSLQLLIAYAFLLLLSCYAFNLSPFGFQWLLFSFTYLIFFYAFASVCQFFLRFSHIATFIQFFDDILYWMTRHRPISLFQLQFSVQRYKSLFTKRIIKLSINSAGLELTWCRSYGCFII